MHVHLLRYNKKETQASKGSSALAQRASSSPFARFVSIRCIGALALLLSTAFAVQLSQIDKVRLTPVKAGAAFGKEVKSGSLFSGPTVVFAVRRPG